MVDNSKVLLIMGDACAALQILSVLTKLTTKGERLEVVHSNVV